MYKHLQERYAPRPPVNVWGMIWNDTILWGGSNDSPYFGATDIVLGVGGQE